LHQQAELKSQQTQLAGMLGIPNDDRWQIAVDIKLPSEAETEDVQSFISTALETRMDYLAANARIDVLAGRLGIANWQRWLQDLEAGYERERETDGAKLRGPTVAVNVPLFNQHRDSVLRARTELQIAATSLEKMRNEIANEIFLHIAALENARKRINKYKQQLIPARRAVVALLQKEVNFMLTGIFDLLAAKQDEYSAYQEYLAAIRDYWSAHTRLSQAVGRDLDMGNDFSEKHLKIHDLLETVSPMDHALHGNSKQMPEQIPGNSSDHSGHQHGGVQ
jgi:cobalt-zinc-cadmium efflux system outer membrane protein